MSTNAHYNDQRSPTVTPELVEAAILRGRHERSKAFWSMLQSIFGRPESREVDERQSDELYGGRRPPTLAAGRSA
jgi:hypothetical protein